MNKISNIIMILLVVIFILAISKYYSSNKNISLKNYNRLNIDRILKEKINNLPILVNDTNNVIEFNDKFENDDSGDKKRSFWNLLKAQ